MSGLLRAVIPAEGPASFEGIDHGAGLSFFLVDTAPGRGSASTAIRTRRCSSSARAVPPSASATTGVDAEPGDVVVAPAGTPHGFVNSGRVRLRLVAIHQSPEFVTEWLEEESD